VLNVAMPPDKVPMPTGDPLSLNITVPVAPEVTVAVKVTELPYVVDVVLGETLVADPALLTV